MPSKTDGCPRCGHPNDDGFCRPEPRHGPEAYFCRQRGLTGEQVFAPAPYSLDVAVAKDEAVIAAAEEEDQARSLFEAVDIAYTDKLGEVAELRLRISSDPGGWSAGGGRWGPGATGVAAAQKLPAAELALYGLEEQRETAAARHLGAKRRHRYELDRARMRRGGTVMFPEKLPGAERLTVPIDYAV